MEAVDRIVARNAWRVGPRRACFGPRVTDDLEHQAVRVGEGEHLFGFGSRGSAPRRALIGDAVPNEPLDPEADRARHHGEGRDGDLADSDAPAVRARPGEECHDAPRRADLVAVVQMVGLRIVEVDGALDEPQSEQSGIEVDVPLRIAGDRGDVVNAEDVAHAVAPPGGSVIVATLVSIAFLSSRGVKATSDLLLAPARSRSSIWSRKHSVLAPAPLAARSARTERA